MEQYGPWLGRTFPGQGYGTYQGAFGPGAICTGCGGLLGEDVGFLALHRYGVAAGQRSQNPNFWPFLRRYYIIATFRGLCSRAGDNAARICRGPSGRKKTLSQVFIILLRPSYSGSVKPTGAESAWVLENDVRSRILVPATGALSFELEPAAQPASSLI